VRKKFSIIIIPGTGDKTRTYTISQFGVRLLMGVFICILVGTGWLIFEYGNIIEKSLKINALKRENQEMHEKYDKLELFAQEFDEFKHRTNKIANLLGVSQEPNHSTPTKVTVSFSPTLSSSRISPSNNLSEDIIPKKKEEQSSVPSIHPVKGWITQKFSSEHSGIDFAADLGTPVFSTMDGTVKFVGWDDILGNIVKITNKEGFKTVYGHLSRVTTVEGVQVKTGGLIGFVGSTGKSSAPHLHYEVWLNGVLQNPEHYLIGR